MAITEAGTDKMERWLGVDNLFGNDFSMARHLEQALKAEVLYQRDRDYVVKDGEVVIVDEFTGRLMPGRRWSEGLHQAVEAKEGVKIQNESRTLATVTFQNYFRMYDKLAGMTGTAETEAEEFAKIYDLEVVVVPTNRDMIRDDFADLVFRNQNGQVERGHRRDRRGAREGAAGPGRHHQRGGQRDARRDAEAARHQAQRAERQVPREGGGDRRPGRARRARSPSPPTWPAAARTSCSAATRRCWPPRSCTRPAPTCWRRRRSSTRPPWPRRTRSAPRTATLVIAAGGLHILGTERHEARRIDNQLRGRAGRQGDPGSSRFYLSLEDDLMRRFASDRVSSIMGRLGFDDETALESGMVSRTIEGAQTRVEGYNFDARKHVVQYDDVINRQRETIYHERERILRSKDLSPTILTMLDEEVRGLVLEHTADDGHGRGEPRGAEGAPAGHGAGTRARRRWPRSTRSRMPPR